MSNYPGQGYYNYPQPGGYGGYPGQQAAPGMGQPPGMGPPGMGPLGGGPAPPGGYGAPGMYPPQQQYQQAPQYNQQGGYGRQAQFELPQNMPRFDTTAPVIHLGTGGGGGARQQEQQYGDNYRRGDRQDQSGGGAGNRRHGGLGYEGRGDRHDRQHERAVEPTREEIARTIFVGNIRDADVGANTGLERILNAAGGLRRWRRVADLNGKPTTFGFAEYEDADSLATAAKLFEEVEVPMLSTHTDTEGEDAKKDEDKEMKDQDEGYGEDSHDAEEAAREKERIENFNGIKLLVIIDENSQKYIESWRERGSLKDPTELQFRLDTAKEELQNVLSQIKRGQLDGQDINYNAAPDQNGEKLVHMQTTTDELTGEVVTVPIIAEDELSDIPAEMRELVASEIASFRERSIKRDMDRLKRQQEIEQAGQNNISRQSDPSARGANGIPLGRGVPNAPAGPRSQQQRVVSYVNGTGVSGAGPGFVRPNEDNDDTDASDEELERRRRKQKDAKEDKVYRDHERNWLHREQLKSDALQRNEYRQKTAADKAAAAKEEMARRLREWDDDVEAERRVEQYYENRSAWVKQRAAFLRREEEDDRRDREEQKREQARQEQRRNHQLSMADDFLARTADEVEAEAREPLRFKMSLPAASALKSNEAAHRSNAEVEKLLEDDEDQDPSQRRRPMLQPLPELSRASLMTEEERRDAAKELALEIPNTSDELWAWPVKWQYIDDTIIEERLTPFVSRKVMDYLGVQEDMLVEAVEDHIRKRGTPQDLVQNLSEAMEEEAEQLVRKLWRMIIFFSESEARGLGTT